MDANYKNDEKNVVVDDSKYSMETHLIYGKNEDRKSTRLNSSH